MAEKKLEKRIILNLKLFGFYVYKTSSFGNCYDYNISYNEAGIADLVVIGGKNKVTFLEVKTDKGRQSKSQKVFQELCEKSEVIYRVVRSVSDAMKAVK